MTHRQQQAAFLDRDGTVIEDTGYLATLDDIRFLPGAILAIKRLNDAGFLVVIATNQSGVARGYFSESFVLDVHEAMNRQLRSHGAALRWALLLSASRRWIRSRIFTSMRVPKTEDWNVSTREAALGTLFSAKLYVWRP